MTKKPKKLLSLLLLLILGFFFPLHSVKAQFDPLATLIAKYIYAYPIRLFLQLSQWFLQLTTSLLNWVLSEDFITWSYTGTDNPIIAVGWGLMRDLVNMFFLIALIFIGLSTALKIGEYQFQKALPRLLIMALLVNFTPVVCGVIVDASNIIMHFFIAKLSGMELLGQHFAAQTGAIAGRLGLWPDLSAVIQVTLQALVMTAVNLSAGLTFFIFSFLFALRHLAIWIAVILSPVAFFSFVFPKLPGPIGGLWGKWWNQFLQWCFVGIPAAFFLYLGNYFLAAVFPKTLIGVNIPLGAGLERTWQELLNIIVPLGLGIALLIIGFFQSMKSAAMGTTYAISGAKWVGGAIMGAGAFVGKTAARRGRRFIREKAPQPVKERLAKWAEKGMPEPLETTSEEAAMGWRKWVRPQTWGKAIGRGLYRGVVLEPAWRLGKIGAPKTEMEEIEKAKEEAGKAMTPRALLAYIRKATSRVQRIAGLQVAGEKGWIEDLKDAGLTPNRIILTGKEALEVASATFKPIRDLFPDLAEEMGKGLPEAKRKAAGLVLSDEDREKYETITEKLVATASSSNIEKWSKSTVLSDEVQDAIHKFWSGRQISSAAREFGRDFAETFMKEVTIRGREWYEKENPQILRYLRGQGAQNLGLTLPMTIGAEVVLPPATATPQERLVFIQAEIARSERMRDTLMRTREAERTSEEQEAIKSHAERLKILEDERERLEKLITAPPEAPEEERGVEYGPGTQPPTPPSGPGIERGPGT